MSWDIVVMASSSPPPPVEQMPADWHGDYLGSLEEIRAKISQVFPQVDWADPSWGIYDGDGCSFEFSIGKRDPSAGFGIHVRGAGPAVSSLLAFAESTGWYLLDCSQGEWLHHCRDTEAGWSAFQAYRDKVIAATNSDTTGRAEHATLDLAEITSEEDLHRAFVIQLHFPAYYGMNWNAFWDIVAGEAGLPRKLTIKNSSLFRQRLPAVAARLERIVKEAADKYSWLDTKIEWQ